MFDEAAPEMSADSSLQRRHLYTNNAFTLGNNHQQLITEAFFMYTTCYGMVQIPLRCK